MATPKDHAVQVRRATERKNAVSPGGVRLAYSTSTGDVRTLRVDHEHVMSEVYADLPGGVTIGYCDCGEYMRIEGV